MNNSENTITLKDLESWSHDKFSISDSDLGKVVLGDYDISFEENSLKVIRSIHCEKEITIEIPGISGFLFVLGSDNESRDFDVCVTFGDDIKVSLENIKAKIHFPSSIFKPVENVNGKFKVIPDKFAEIGITIDVTYKIGGGIEEVNVLDKINIPPMMIADTGIVIEAKEVELIFSSEKAEQARLPSPEWRGIIIKKANIYPPFDFHPPPDQFELTDLKIGSLGLSGTISYTGYKDCKILGFAFFLKEFNISFMQNVITDSRIKGDFILHFFNVVLNVDICLNPDGDFTFYLEDINEDGFVESSYYKLFKLRVKSVEFEKKEEKTLLRLTGAIKLLGDFSDLEWIDIQGISFDTEGNISIDGSWLPVPRQLSFNFHGFTVEVTKIGFGKDNGWKWIGFCGGIQLIEGLSLGGSIEGLRFKWKANDSKVELSGIGIDFTIPNVLSFNGTVAYFEEVDKNLFEGRHLFRGGIKLKLFPLNIAFNSQLIIGYKDGNKVLFIFIEGELPVGIPLFSTGLSLYGMAGLYGQNVRPKKSSSEKWIKWGRRNRGPRNQDNWDVKDASGDFAFGAGCKIGTAADNGYCFNAKLLLIMLIPGPVIILEGKADFLNKMGEVSEGSKDNMLYPESTFYTLAVLDCRAGNFLFNISAGYELLKDSGWILDIDGSSEAFFDFFNFYNWHLYLGQKDPSDKRLRAKFINLFEANSYFMLGRYFIEGWKFGLATGAMVGYDRKWKFGPVRVTLAAWIEGNGYISFSPPQFGGDLWLQGGFDISVFGFGFGFSVGAGIAANTPTPYFIRAEMKIKINLPWPLPDPSIRIVLEWKIDKDPQFESPLEGLSIEHLKVSEKVPLLDYDNDSQEQKNLQIAPIIPLDARPTVIFSKSVNDEKRIGVNAFVDTFREPSVENPLHPELIPPEKPKHGTQYEVLYELTGLSIYSKSEINGKWSIMEKERKVYGTWLADSTMPLRHPREQEDIHRLVPKNTLLSMTKLMLWAVSPFEYYREQENTPYRELSGAYPKPCNYLTTKIPPYCMDFEDLNEGESRQVISRKNVFLFHYEFPLLIYKNDKWKTWANVRQGIELPSGGSKLNIYFDKKYATNIKLYSGKWAQDILVPGSGKSNLCIQSFCDDQKIWEKTNIDVSETPISVNPENNKEKINLITISGQNAVLLKMLYHLADEVEGQEEFNLKVFARVQKIKEAWDGADFLFEPNHLYKIKIETKIHYRKNGEEDWKEYPHPKTKYAYFRTGGPPGYEKSENFPELNTLKHYIKRSIPQTDFHRPALHYRTYDVGVEFNENYVEKMYAMADNPLSIKLFDNNDNPLELNAKNSWSEGIKKSHTISETWREVLNQCVSLKIRVKERTIHLVSNYTLEPQTLYIAKLRSKDYYPYKFNFITSRFATFVHHIHSFSDAVWDYYTISEKPGTPLLNSNKLGELKKLILSVRNGDKKSANAFQTIFHEYFNMGYRQLPQKFELTLLRDKNRSYAFLMESPEPLDWKRILLTIYQVSTKAPNIPDIPASTAHVKIIDACIDPDKVWTDNTKYSLQWVDVLIQEEMELYDFLIVNSGNQYSVKSNPDSSYKKYFQFDNQEKWPAGTIFRIHAGQSGINQMVPAPPERIHYFTGNISKKEKFLLNKFGDTIRIIDNKGKNLYEHYFIRLNYFTKLNNIVTIQNADQTRAFVFLLTQNMDISEIPNKGRMRFEFIFKGKIGTEKDDYIILKRAGRDSEEIAAIEFSLPPQLP